MSKKKKKKHHKKKKIKFRNLNQKASNQDFSVQEGQKKEEAIVQKEEKPEIKPAIEKKEEAEEQNHITFFNSDIKRIILITSFCIVLLAVVIFILSRTNFNIESIFKNIISQ